jgi:Ca-activated chloride channel family protein
MNKTAVVFIVVCLSVSAGYSQDKASARSSKLNSASLDKPEGPSLPTREQEGPEIQPSMPGVASEYLDFTISKQTDEVNLILSVTDSKGRFVNNLTADDLKLLDNHKAPAKWNYFQARTDLPLSVILAIDVSSSVRDRLHFEQQAASAFLKHILRKETDEAAIVAFGSTVEEKSKGMTSDAKALDATIHSLQAGGETAMYDAIILASHKLRANRKKGVVRPVIILITDGDDTASKSTLRAAEEAAARSEAAIFALDANSRYEKHPKGRVVLDKLTRETGGFVLSTQENSDLKGAFATIEKILRSQYALGYPPPELEANGGFRPIEVTSSKRGLKIHARNGYYAPGK